MNNLILYWNSVWKSGANRPAVVGQPHTAQEYAAFDRSMRRKTPLERQFRKGGTRLARKALRLVTNR